MSVVPNGRIERDHEGHPTLVIVREFAAPIEDVWASVTEPARLERWIGTFTGDPASGSVMFAMTAESDVRRPRRWRSWSASLLACWP